MAFNYRVTVSVRRGGETIVGSNVRRLRWHQGIEQLGFMDVSSYRTRGEATLVALEKGPLLATLAYKTFNRDLQAWYVESDVWTPDAAFRRVFGADRASWRRKPGRPVELTPAEFPLLVTFRDPQDPQSVTEVDPDDLQPHFGPGVALKSITVEVTRHAPTRGLKRQLPWIVTLEGKTLSGDTAKGRSTALGDNLYVSQLSSEN
ncbi:hypothetical protein [Phenylobacterium kunshanense]|uniref:hypothetical protein n=1 Tax=Phenylobacterium kunshanense TaxID=1445034 RepID=UPI0010577EDC|nr:hypothetical protein [Phenylobacterium kunshanense]